MKRLTQEELDVILGKHQKWLNNEPDGETANLSNCDVSELDFGFADMSFADMSGANMSGADMSDANMDFSCLPLWCGSLSAHFDDKLLTQIAYHLVKAGLQSKNASEETKAELSRLIDFANGFHRVNECGAIEKE